MIWFDPTAAFARRFEPMDGGYLFYPRAKGPGKLVSPAEYEALVVNYRRWMGGRFKPGLMFAVLFGAILIIAVISVLLDVPPEGDGWFAYPLLLLVAGFMFWLHFAPHRLVKGRPDAAPPRAKKELGRATRRMMTWPLIAFGTGLSGLWAAVGLAAKPSVGVIVWTVIWAVVFVSYLRIAVQKIQDARN
jgi:hypothetical protein